MLTLIEVPAEIDPTVLRLAALLGISTGLTPVELRSRATGTPQELADKRIADEMDLLTTCGYTRQIADAVLRERGPFVPARPRTDEEAHQSDRRVAAAAISQHGAAAVGIFRRAAAIGDDDAVRKSFIKFAAAAEELLAESPA
jgi:hypothetical protein